MAHQESQANLAKIKGPILWPLAIAFALLLCAFFAVVWIWSSNQQQRDLVDNIQRFDDVLFQSIADQSKLLSQNQRWIIQSVLPVLETGRVDDLESVLQSALTLSMDGLHIERIVLLDVAGGIQSQASVQMIDPNSTLADSVTQASMRSKQLSTGVVLSPDGELLLRLVSPVLDKQDRLLGFLLTDKPLDKLITNIAVAQSMYVSIMASENTVDITALTQRGLLLGRPFNASVMSGYVSINSSNLTLDPWVFEPVLTNYQRQNFDREIFYQPGIEVNETLYDVAIVPLLGHQGQAVARLILANDVSRIQDELRIANITTATLASIIMILLFTFFYFLLGRVEARIRHSEQELVDARNLADQHLIDTERLKLDAERSRDHAENARVAAENASRVKSEFLAKMSHELRTPLNAIIGLTEMMHEDAIEFGDEDYIEPTERVVRAAKHLLSLINDILDISKIEAGKMELHKETFDLTPVLQDVMATIKPLTDKKNIALLFDAEDIGSLHNDPTRLRQILLNLLSNATKFTNEGCVSLSVSQDQDLLNFTVTDTGIGMTDAEATGLFQEFVQLDSANNRKHDGTGLGLAISRKFARMMGGDIFLESEKDKGSKFTLTIPLSHELPVIDESLQIKIGTEVQKVLVVDDDEIVQQLLTRHLEADGYDVECVGDGVTALQKIRQNRPDLITLDLAMPGLTGWDTLAALRADPELSDIPVIIISFDDDKSRGIALGAKAFLSKPVEGGDLENAIASLKTHIDLEQCDVLVIDDSEDVRLLIHKTLTKIGWQVREAQNGQEGLLAITAQKPDLIILDLMMPIMDGFDFLERFDKYPQWHDIPVVVMTAMSLTSNDRQLLSAHVASIMQKGDFNRDKLIQTITRLLQRG